MINKQYEQASREQKRVMIAQDIIDQVNAGIYIPAAGAYLKEICTEDEKDATPDRRQDIQSFLPETKSCHVCNIGSIILSMTRFENQLTFCDLNINTMSKSPQLSNMLLELFTVEELMSIEYLFEGQFYGHIFGGVEPNSENIDTRLLDNIRDNYKVSVLIRDMPTGYHKSLILAIMKNIVKNAGILKLEELATSDFKSEQTQG